VERKECDESGRKIIDEEMKRFVTENVVREDAAVTRRSDWKTDPNRGQTEGEEGGGGWKQNCWPARSFPITWSCIFSSIHLGYSAYLLVLKKFQNLVSPELVLPVCSNESAPLRLHSKKKCLCTLRMVPLRGAFNDGDGDNFE